MPSAVVIVSMAFCLLSTTVSLYTIYIYTYICIYIYIERERERCVCMMPYHVISQPVVSCIWGFGYNFTNYNFRKALDLLFKCLTRGVDFKGFF